MVHEEKSKTSMSFIQSKSSMSYLQSKSSLEGTTVYAKNICYREYRQEGKNEAWRRMKNGHEQIFLAPTKKAFSRAYKRSDLRRFSDISGHCAWIRKRFLPRSSIGYHTVAVELWYYHELSSGCIARLGQGYMARKATGKQA